MINKNSFPHLTLRRRLSSCTGELKDEVFYKKDEDILSSHTINASEDDYYKEVEVRINPEGIAVVRRRHRMLPDSDRFEFRCVIGPTMTYVGNIKREHGQNKCHFICR